MIQPRGLDHLIHLVRDLDAAEDAYERLGFSVGRENHHPFGTKNRIIQFPGVFIELLAIGDHAPIPEHAPQVFSFAAFHRDLLARSGEGGSGVAFESRNAQADADSFRKAGLGDHAPFHFERRGFTHDGRETHVAFDLVFAVDLLAPDLCVFACEHAFPENFWNEAAQHHANGATGVAAVELTAENPSDHQLLLSVATGVRDFRASSSGLFIETPRGRVEALTPEAFARSTGAGAAPRDGLGFSGLRVAVEDLDLAAEAIDGLGGHVERRGDRLVASPAGTFGLVLSFEARRPDSGGLR